MVTRANHCPQIGKNDKYRKSKLRAAISEETSARVGKNWSITDKLLEAQHGLLWVKNSRKTKALQRPQLFFEFTSWNLYQVLTVTNKAPSASGAGMKRNHSEACHHILLKNVCPEEKLFHQSLTNLQKGKHLSQVGSSLLFGESSSPVKPTGREKNLRNM